MKDIVVQVVPSDLDECIEEMDAKKYQIVAMASLPAIEGVTLICVFRRKPLTEHEQSVERAEAWVLNYKNQSQAYQMVET